MRRSAPTQSERFLKIMADTQLPSFCYPKFPRKNSIIEIFTIGPVLKRQKSIFDLKISAKSSKKLGNRVFSDLAQNTKKTRFSV